MIEKINTVIFQYINRYAGINAVLDRVVIIIAKYLWLVFILWLFYLWIKRNQKYKNIILYSCYSAILGALLNFLISFFYYHPRPFMIGAGKLLIQHLPQTSFPSDHTTFMLSVAFMLIYFKETKTAGLALAILGFIGGLARIFCGLHFPVDIVGSFGVALLSSFSIYFLKNKLEPLNKVIINLYTRIAKKGKITGKIY